MGHLSNFRGTEQRATHGRMRLWCMRVSTMVACGFGEPSFVSLEQACASSSRRVCFTRAADLADRPGPAPMALRPACAATTCVPVQEVGRAHANILQSRRRSGKITMSKAVVTANIITKRRAVESCRARQAQRLAAAGRFVVWDVGLDGWTTIPNLAQTPVTAAETGSGNR